MGLRADGALVKSHPSSRGRSAGVANAGLSGTQTRPMMLAVAISSSSSASDTWPETV